MMTLLSRVFSDRYANQAAIGNNLLLLLMYRFVFPFARLFNAFGLTPNQLTTLSCVTAVASGGVLILRTDAWPFVLLWGLSLLLDFCDGTIARMSGRVSRSAFRFDHMSDLVKVSVVIIAAGLRHQDTTLWLLVCTALFSFLYYAVISQELKAARLQLPAVPSGDDKAGSCSFQSKLPPLVRVVYAALVTVNGHTLLVFFALPFGQAGTAIPLIYLTAVTLFGVLVRVRILLTLPKPRRT